MQATNPFAAAWEPETHLVPVAQLSREYATASDVAIVTPLMLGANPYDFVAGGATVVYSPIFRLQGYTQATVCYAKGAFTGGAETINIQIASAVGITISPGPSFGPQVYHVEGTGVIAIGAALLTDAGHRSFPSANTTTAIYPFNFACLKCTLDFMPVAFSLWLSVLAWNPGFRA